MENIDNYNTNGLYRMPWTMSDNSSTWLEITRNCDLTCEYCAQHSNPESHKTLKEITHELDSLLNLRKCDSVVIAGGEPLTHPDIVSVVKLVKKRKLKPMIITNSFSLTKERIIEFKKSGLFGFIIHIDSGQNRPGRENKSETELNILRQHYADQIHEVKGLICSFITTIIPSALEEVSEIIQWTTDNADRVQQNILIPVRGIYKNDPWDYYVNAKKIAIEKTSYFQDRNYRNMTVLDLQNMIIKKIPNLKYSSFLGGTHLAQSPKWLISLGFISNNNFYGSTGPKVLELMQTWHHLFKGKYLSFLKPVFYRLGKLAFIFAIFYKGVRNALGNYVKSYFLNPSIIFKKVYLQVIILMQPFDVLSNGEHDMCDGCPNKTYWNGRLVSECRMEEYLEYGRLMEFVNKCS